MFMSRARVIGIQEGWGWNNTAMGAGASVKRSPTSLIAEIDKLRERELNAKVTRGYA